MFLGKSFPCLVLCLLVLLSLSCRQVSFPSGTKLSGNDPAAPFLLQNQFGSDKSLYDYAGKVVVLTFLYTSCSDICPVVARHLRTTYEVLKNKDTEFNIVVISVDPKRDSVERVYEYSKRWSMLNKWDFLTGEEQLLLPIWKAYYVSEPITSFKRKVKKYLETKYYDETYDLCNFKNINTRMVVRHYTYKFRATV